jgi:hypothetical protein
MLSPQSPWRTLGLMVWLCLSLSFHPSTVAAHRAGCHRWHASPSDHGTYVCGDTGRCSECPDNTHCLNREPRTDNRPAPPSLASPLASARQEQFSGKVVALADGDTLSVLRDGKAAKVRLWGIDTPEKAQAFGTRARQFGYFCISPREGIFQKSEPKRNVIRFL